MTAGARKITFWLFLASLGMVCFFSFVPIALRPKTGLLGIERTLPFAALSALLALSYPKRPVLVLLAALLIAFGSEFGQTFIASRHSEITDAYEKCFGASVGVVAGVLIDQVLAALQRSG